MQHSPCFFTFSILPFSTVSIWVTVLNSQYLAMSDSIRSDTISPTEYSTCQILDEKVHWQYIITPCKKTTCIIHIYIFNLFFLSNKSHSSKTSFPKGPIWFIHHSICLVYSHFIAFSLGWTITSDYSYNLVQVFAFILCYNTSIKINRW